MEGAADTPTASVGQRSPALALPLRLEEAGLALRNHGRVHQPDLHLAEVRVPAEHVQGWHALCVKHVVRGVQVVLLLDPGPPLLDFLRPGCWFGLPATSPGARPAGGFAGELRIPGEAGCSPGVMGLDESAMGHDGERRVRAREGFDPDLGGKLHGGIPTFNRPNVDTGPNHRGAIP